MTERTRAVAFAEQALEQAFLRLREGKFEDRLLYASIVGARDVLMDNPSCGDQVAKRLIRKAHIRKYGAKLGHGTKEVHPAFPGNACLILRKK